MNRKRGTHDVGDGGVESSYEGGFQVLAAVIEERLHGSDDGEWRPYHFVVMDSQVLHNLMLIRGNLT
jgi:hypothetical protein